MAPSEPISSASRLAALRQTGLLDSAGEERFDRLARLAARFLEAPVAQVNFVDQDRQFSKSTVGIAAGNASRSIPLERSYCQHVVASGKPLVIRDARVHPLVRDNPSVTREGIIAYAGVPLTTPDDHTIGSLCVLDLKPRQWDKTQLTVLQDLAASVMTEIELRLEIAETGRALRISEGRFRALVENIGEIITILEPGGAILYKSAAIEPVLGYGADALVGRNAFDLIHRDDVNAVRAVFAAALAAPGEHFPYIVRFRHHDGSWQWLEGVVVNLLHDPDVGGLVATSRDVTEQRKAERHFQRLVESVRDYAIFTLDDGGTVLSWNAGAERMTGYTADEAIGSPFTLFYRDEDLGAGAAERELRQARDAGTATGSGLRKRKDGTNFWSHEVLTVLEDGQGPEMEFVKVVQDISELEEAEARIERAEEQLRQSQKMEAVGRLASGIAHDFNNLLTAIRGNAEFLLQDLDPEGDSHADAEEIKRAADRAAALTAQLLTFGRKQALNPRVLELNALVAGIEKILRRVIGEDIEFVTRLDPSLRRVRVDSGQIGQVLMNLAVNARDAMPRGGKLIVRSQNVDVDEQYARDYAFTIAPGEYVMLSVSDTGDGMSKAVRERIFEPFFTTKEEGKGTGLGLATVYGIVQQSGGHIHVYSEPGHGTTFRVYLPRTDVAEDPPADVVAKSVRLPATAKVLLVEDDAVVRSITHRMLEREGYQVEVAVDVAEALRIAEDPQAKVDLLITDLVMPGMNGRELATRVRAILARCRVLLVSGYADEVVTNGGALAPGTAFLQKPFSRADLARAVADLLASAPTSPESPPE